MKIVLYPEFENNSEKKEKESLPKLPVSEQQKPV